MGCKFNDWDSLHMKPAETKKKEIKNLETFGITPIRYLEADLYEEKVFKWITYELTNENE